MNGHVIKPLILLAIATLAGCASQPVIVDTACSWVRPILVSKDDALTDGTAGQILTHNKQWKRVCGTENQR